MSDKPHVYPPLPAGHPAIGRECAVCRSAIAEGDETYLEPYAPASLEDAEKALAGRPCTMVCDLAHWKCWKDKGATP